MESLSSFKTLARISCKSLIRRSALEITEKNASEAISAKNRIPITSFSLTFTGPFRSSHPLFSHQKQFKKQSEAKQIKREAAIYNKEKRKIGKHPDALVEDAYRELEEEGYEVDRGIDIEQQTLALEEKSGKRKDSFF
eukprot:TRINITY_DN9769_c0_g1_i1.p1 TRINITY_DN9769_c0_g1~~TRINITY_DN9769_c0_g1_i1.p1  ORF type:complete len:159 (+),score=5.61 TRINITY_DN9769_c0_g1_i1:64-477(+)